jgi:triosephosphate isomerase
VEARGRTPLVAANWKMNLVSGQARAFCRDLLAGLGFGAAYAPVVEEPAVDVVLFPSAPLLAAVGRELAGTPVAWGGQDLHAADAGAHTGDVSGLQLADAGCSWALCGHSERRSDHGEDDSMVADKVVAAARCGLAPMLCLGETREERQDGRTFDVLEHQLRAAFAELPGFCALAYEPVWAIGTGDTATPEMAQEAHRFLRRTVEKLSGSSGRAAEIRILYGGSANPDNAAALFAQPDLDGFLVGGASLDAARFLAIIRACGRGEIPGYHPRLRCADARHGGLRMIYLLYFLHVFVSIFLILVVLLQQGKGADLSVFGGGSTQAAFGARGATQLIHKLTVGSFIMFIVTTLSIGILKGRERGGSIMTQEVVEQTAPAAAPEAEPALPEAEPLDSAGGTSPEAAEEAPVVEDPESPAESPEEGG